jgi:aryl-alcohol dehydrogenase-like predicted oxidoreductase
MHYRNLSSSNLKVSALCLGTMMFRPTAQPEAAAIVADAHARGVRLDIDTADVYTKGASGNHAWRTCWRATPQLGAGHRTGRRIWRWSGAAVRAG